MKSNLSHSFVISSTTQLLKAEIFDCGKQHGVDFEKPKILAGQVLMVIFWGLDGYFGGLAGVKKLFSALNHYVKSYIWFDKIWHFCHKPWDSIKFKSDMWMKSRSFKGICCFGLFFEVFSEHKKLVVARVWGLFGYGQCCF